MGRALPPTLGMLQEPDPRIPPALLRPTSPPRPQSSSGRQPTARRHVKRHRHFRFCKIALLAQGVGAKAAFAAIARQPAAFGTQLRVVSACQLAMPQTAGQVHAHPA
eukprot:1832208-Prymnesium_polylepis.3